MSAGNVHPSPTTSTVGNDPTSGINPLESSTAETLPLNSTQPGSTAYSPLPSLPGYEIVDELGRGGMGVVYRAVQIELKRVVALKMMLGGSQAAPADIQRFHIEVEAAARLNHLHIVPIYQVGSYEGHHYFSMKLCEGGSLAHALARGQWNAKSAEAQKQIAEFMAQVARAVECAHAAGILHRDLKPGNILLDSQGRPHITDFGLAKRVEGGQSLTQTGTVLGTPSYMAPEQAAGKKLSAAADVYSLGAILYELLTQRPPFTGDSPLEILVQVAGREPTSPRSECPAVARDLETICLKALAKDPLQRYASAGEMADDLDRFVHGQTIKAQRISQLQRLQHWIRRDPRSALRAGVGIVVLLVIIGMLAVSYYFAARGDGSYDRVLAAGKVMIGIDPVYPPMEFERDGKVVGFDVDLARALAKRLGVAADLKFTHTDWRDVPVALNSGQCDLVISSWTITEDRKKQVTFVEYLRMGQVYVCPKGGKVTRDADLVGKTVAVNEETIAHKYVQALQQKGFAFKEVKVIKGSADPFPMLKSGAADVTIVDEAVGKFQAREDPGVIVTGYVGHAMDPSPIGIVLRKRDLQLQAKVREELDRLKADGDFQRMLGEWFGE